MDSTTHPNTTLATLEARRLRAFLIPAVRPADLARKSGYSKQFVGDVMAGRCRAPARMIEAARELGLPIEVIWPDYEEPKGSGP